MQGKPLISLDDKVVLVTGASRGIGAAIAQACAQSGAQVVLASRKQEGLDAVAAEIAQAGGQAVAIACHMGQPEQIRALYQRATDTFGRVDVLVNNAATNPYFGPMVGITEAAFDKTIEVNMKGYFWAIREHVDHLRSRGGPGSIVNIASVAGLGGAVGQGVYAMTKAAVISMTQTLAIELGSSGIRVNAIAPGLIRTRFAGALVDNPAIVNRVVKRTPLGRVGDPTDIAGAAVLLASDAAAYITGETLIVDGGLTAGTLGIEG
jgi:NAD(P)-dependent dehydrogenase (short-subunit alcohol dehydrogenase family)